MHEEGEWESDCWESLAVLRNPPGFARYPLGQTLSYDLIRQNARRY